jgi:hypothetical protein
MVLDVVFSDIVFVGLEVVNSLAGALNNFQIGMLAMEL